MKNVGKNVTFANLTYTEKNAGKTYTYYLQEVVPDMEVPGYGFDNTVHTVEVTVTDNGDGTLKVEKTIDVRRLKHRKMMKQRHRMQYLPTPTVQRAVSF